MGNPTIHVLVCCFKKGKTELGIGTMDSIVFPKTFVSLPNLEDKIRMLKEFISGKTDVALNFPKHSVSGEDPSIQLELRAGHVITFSDMEVLEITRDAMMKSKPKSARSTKILHSTPKSQVAPKPVASVSYAKKSLPPTVGDTSNSEPIDNNKRKTTKRNPSRSKDQPIHQAIKPTADEVSDLGVSALPSSESEESDSGNEEVDWLAPSPRTRNKIPRTDVDRCIGGSASSNGAVHSAVHRNEVILTPPVSRCNTPSSFRTPYCLYSLLPYCFPHQLSNMFAVTPLYKLPVMCLIVSLQLSNMFAVTSLYKLPVMRLLFPSST
ncbi:uncharacterized protein LOC124207610 isoform X3 [Daphnia pulex]|uniref:uncharacterized protein LOC124207610 isoform X3 n=1 Tax=Daphnia pulex TaxID=6669 RepID=UPI001EDFED24|nr:uncharacterized protein LOC124207610 isoform X3 [Daphnia pulex]